MNKERITRGLAVVITAMALGFLFANWTPTKTTAGIVTLNEPTQEKTVEHVRKNIQVLKGLPDSKLLTVMHFMRASLGVRCDYCHIAENDKYWIDDKPAKQTARKHIQMVFDINKASYGGKTVVTCNTCHQGQPKPVSIPPIGQGAFENTTRAEPDAKPAEALPTSDQILDRYVQALGGKAALEKITSRYARISWLRPKLVNSGTPKAAMINRGETWQLELFHKAPNKYLAIIVSPEGMIYQGFNGIVGWIKTASGQREMTGAEIARIKRQADLYKDLKLKEQYLEMTVTGKEKIGDREAFVIEALAADKRAEKLFFDVQSGLLLRRVALTETMLGMDPEQTDFEDYRDVGGVKLPFIISVSYLDDSHFGTTRKFVDIKINIVIDDSKFDMPAVKQ